MLLLYEFGNGNEVHAISYKVNLTFIYIYLSVL